MDELEKQLSDMEKALEKSGFPEELEEPESEESVEVQSEEPEEGPESEDSEEELEESEEEPEEFDEEIDKNEIEKLKAEIESLKETIKSLKQEDKKEEEEDVEREINFVSDEDDVYEIVGDNKKFNEILNKIYKAAKEDVQKSILKTVHENVIVANYLAKLGEKFYKDNPELEQHRKVVSDVFNEIFQKNSGKSYEELLTMTAKEARRRLKLTKTKDVPSLPKKKGGSRQLPKDVDELQREFEAMDRALGLL